MGRVIRIDHLHREGVGNRSQQDTKQIHILGRKSCAQGCDERVLLVDCETDAAVIGVALPERGLTLLKELLPTPPMHRRSEEHTSELQSLMRISYAVFCLKKKNTTNTHTQLLNKQTTNTI